MKTEPLIASLSQATETRFEAEAASAYDGREAQSQELARR